MRILIFGNSGSGKSTLAKHIAKQYNFAHLDLDPLAWSTAIDGAPLRADLSEVACSIDDFTNEHEEWVIEGCYGNILSLLIKKATTMLFLDLPIETCIAHAKQRPWEPHKYESKASQDANLEMLIEWIQEYPNRTCDLSKISHSKLYNAFQGTKYKLHECPALQENILSNFQTTS